ncbi:hypothetical protein HF324_20940 [Chitinophaga oryzae]|uniref:DUF4843 domain-containing protein n=1 Tax=Chitinophaga oryzae TaxID=2725414 RepID=A0AAE6ZLP4_9BACT|nr:hypothetical protein [Chitinophaga oryzae]QJB33665.1 hypothetical protein HF329_21040 [Chitinophaga oryzae]QJB40191.1 hypothetical protein HF324_20940 [Chitinophaga oryzae]
MLKIKLLGLLVLLIVLNACNKEEAPTKAVNVEVWGYNIGDAELEMSIDTTVYRNFTTLPNMPVTFSRIYTFPSVLKEVSLKIKDKTSGKEVYQQQLNLAGELELFFPFIWMNGNMLKVETTAADPVTNKLSFYIHYPQNNEALDIFLKNDAGQMVIIAQNVKPGGWVHASYIPGEGFKDKSKRYTLYFTKTGTTDGWYFEDNETKSKVDEFGLVFPKNEEKGLVRAYFVTPGNAQLEVIRLFKRPKA